MAEPTLPVIDQSLLSLEDIEENGNICCRNCEILKSKLQKVTDELSSAYEIIKTLQEDNHIRQTPNHTEEQASTKYDHTTWTR